MTKATWRWLLTAFCLESYDEEMIKIGINMESLTPQVSDNLSTKVRPNLWRHFFIYKTGEYMASLSDEAMMGIGKHIIDRSTEVVKLFGMMAYVMISILKEWGLMNLFRSLKFRTTLMVPFSFEISCDSRDSYFCLLQQGTGSSTMLFKNMAEIIPLIRFAPHCVCVFLLKIYFFLPRT